MTEVWYDNVNPFSGVSTVPFISKDQEMISYNARWGQQTTFQLAGMLTGCTFEALIEGQNQLLASFARDFKSLEIRKNGDSLFNFPYCRVASITFDQDDYAYTIPYTINLICYEEEYFTGTYGVLNPQNTFEFTEQKDGTIEILHTISCNGFNTSAGATNALLNAEDYVHGLSGWNHQVLPHFINYCTGESGFLPLLRGQEERINRWDASYQLVERYVFDPAQVSGVYRYTTTFNSGINDDFSTVSIQGTLAGGKNMSIDELRNIYLTKDLFSPAAETYMIFAGSGYLNDAYVSSGINENERNKEIAFNVVFTDDRRPLTYLEYVVQTSYDLEDKLNTVRINGDVLSRLPLNQRYQAAKDYYMTGVDIFALVVNNIDPGIVLNPKPIQVGYSENEWRGEISFNRTYNDRVIPPSGLDEFRYNVQVVPPINQYVAAPILEGEGEWVIHNLGYVNRLRLRLDGYAVISTGQSFENGLNIIRTQMNSQRQYYMQQFGFKGRLVLDEQEVTRRASSNNREVDFSYGWSFEANTFTI